MLRNPVLRLERGVVDLKVATNHISDRENNTQDSIKWLGCDSPCLLKLSVPAKRPTRQKVA